MKEHPRDASDLASAYLRQALDGFDSGHDPGEQAVEREASRMMRGVSEHLLKSRASLVNLSVETIEAFTDHRNAAAWMLDSLYCHDLLERIPNMVRRTLELSALHIEKRNRPTGSVLVFYEQAVRCYIFGLWQAAAVLARGTVETALRETLEGKPRDTLGDLIPLAVQMRLFPSDAFEALNVVKLLGDPAVHGTAVSENDAKRLVVCARAVIVALFRGRLGAESRPT